ncbi:D-3-phosphoglycerate dehydrogenase [Fictibacillus macauensis ZFHKF-1]|uniref:D-3-phosphoglycerate dehydrogenase n=1 Tax=Fictibacillus macauensis ZFHKF-1 TaxID=1196324 RepID=I8UIA9_9BACL|nr:phosphoglycerate dehydrogenase [Fictibacillus macauensis]EIT86553.1 D-3-phosphoglycerate dehydrogenase [Fictibacillus macauensis ZFHKF-1]
MFQVLATDSIAKEGLTVLENDSNVSVIYGSVDEAPTTIDALIVRSATQVTAELLAQFPSLKIVARAGVGTDNIDIDAASKRGVLVINAPDGNTISTAEHTFAMMMSLLRRIPQANHSILEGKWNRSSFKGSELLGKVVGIIGLGRIGTELAKRLKAFQTDVIVFDPFLTEERAKSLHVQSVSLDALLTTSDIITVHTPLTKETKNLLSKENLAKTKKGVYFINCARGGIYDEEALYDCLKSGHAAGCALDVFIEEPATNNKLVHLPNVVATPHIAASTTEAQLNVAVGVAQEIHGFFNGKTVKNAINLPSVPGEELQKIMPFHELAKLSGQILSQVFTSGVKEIRLSFSGTITDHDTGLVTRGLLSGFLMQRVDRYVNDINAPLIAKEQGFTISETSRSETYGYENCLQVEVIGEHDSFSLQSTYIPGYGPRIVNMNGYVTDFMPEGAMIYIEHVDKPGVIGNVGKLLGDLDINIASMQVGRKKAGGEAIMLLTFDHELTKETEMKIRQLKDVVSAKSLAL